MVVTTSQFAVALYVMYIVVKDFSYSGYSDMCFLGKVKYQCCIIFFVHFNFSITLNNVFFPLGKLLFVIEIL